VFVRQSVLNNFKEEPPITKSVEEGKPFQLPCESPDGWPKPNVYWMIQVLIDFSLFSVGFGPNLDANCPKRYEDDIPP
jgi:hypothetical protein